MFAWQMRYLAKHFCCLRLEEAVALLRGDRPLPRHSVVVTFDDGFRNNLRYAFPILRRYGVPATIFLTTGHIGRGIQLLWTERVGRLLRAAALGQTLEIPDGEAPRAVSFRTAAERDEAARVVMKRLKAMPSRKRDAAIGELETQLRAANREPDAGGEPDAERYTFLTWTEAQDLARGGMTIGSHTVEHPIMSSLDEDRREFEVVASKLEIERQLGAPCTLFSYPNGTADDFGERDKACLQRAGYAAAVTQIAGLNDERTDLFALRRLNIGRGHGRQLFAAQVSGFWPWVRAVATRRRQSTRRAGLAVQDAPYMFRRS
jgi:peptidoglycan/xylan/chitin deacetylase (PgdA/CDA1 family)